MIEYLEQLVEEKKYEEALKEAERVLPYLKDPVQILAAHTATVISHCRLGQERAAVVTGNIAANIASDLAAWDAYGTVILYMANAYSRLGLYNEAIARVYDYLSKIGTYDRALEHEAIARFNLGTWLLLLNRPQEAISSLKAALAATQRTPDEQRFAHGIRQALIEAYLRVNQLEEVPRLLAQCDHFLRVHPDTQMSVESRVFHVKLRSQFALVTNRLKRAETLAVQGLLVAWGTEHEYWFHKVLSSVAQLRQVSRVALGHAIAARCCAIRDNRPDLEAEANELIHYLSAAHPKTERLVEEYYLSR
jgi:tetratricopeptide (TPR) repeat protein